MTITKCDRCGKILQKKSEMYIAELGQKYYDSQIKMAPYDLCRECYLDVWRFVQKTVPEKPDAIEM